uniref:Uncharacterized protein n=1 Tax=Brugia timori TaxID=42155 RepID=A0A0R3QE13_9BILA
MMHKKKKGVVRRNISLTYSIIILLIKKEAKKINNVYLNESSTRCILNKLTGTTSKTIWT